MVARELWFGACWPGSGGWECVSLGVVGFGRVRWVWWGGGGGRKWLDQVSVVVQDIMSCVV